MLSSIPSKMFAEWMAFDRAEPPPDPHFSAALICAVVANSQGAKTDVWDFLPEARRPPRPEQTGMEMKARMLAISAAINASKANGTI